MPQPSDETGIRRRLAKRIRVLRAKRGWSQEVLAEIAGLHRNYIRQVERERVNVGVENLEKFAAAFQVKMGELVDR
jgi:transcriptional regulator with XRE-family HTH domain